jgi:hypothetical protein
MSKHTDEYIYGGWWGGELSNSLIYRFRVTKRTAKRIYYQRPGERIDQHGNPYDEAQFGIRDSDLPREESSIGSIDRWQFEARGRVFNISRGGSERRMYADLADLIARGNPRPGDELESAEECIAYVWRASTRQDDPVPNLVALKTADLAALKTAMVAAHPDKGGSSAAFIKARARYVAARRARRKAGGRAAGRR